MSRLKLLVNNVGFFGGLKALSSLFPLFILPYVTLELKDTNEFGIYDMYLVLGGLGASVAMIGIQDAMFRQYHQTSEENYRNLIITTGLIVVFFTSVLVAIISLIIKPFIQEYLFDDEKYYSVIYFFAIYVILQNISELSVHPSRLRNDRIKILLFTLINLVTFYTSVIALLQLSIGVYSLILSHLITSIVVASAFFSINKNSLFPLKFSKVIATQLIKIGLPLMPIFIIYWANNSISRILIMNYLGSAQLGIYSIGSKYASVSTILQMAFAGGWSFFTYSTMNDVDQVKLKSKIFEYLLFIIVIGYAVITPLTPFIFEFVFVGDYSKGSEVFGQLFLAPLFLILFQIVANQFTIIGKSYYSLLSLFIGLSFGIFLTVLFLELGYGIIYVSYTTPISYLISVLILYYFARNKMIFYIGYRSFISFSVIVIINVLMQALFGISLFISLSLVLISFLFLNRNIITQLFSLAYKLTKKI